MAVTLSFFFNLEYQRGGMNNLICFHAITGLREAHLNHLETTMSEFDVDSSLFI